MYGTLCALFIEFCFLENSWRVGKGGGGGGGGNLDGMVSLRHSDSSVAHWPLGVKNTSNIISLFYAFSGRFG
jgi:hypothetical protein